MNFATFVLAVVTFPIWLPVVVFGGLAFLLCWVAVAIPFVCGCWIYRHFRSPQETASD